MFLWLVSSASISSNERFLTVFTAIFPTDPQRAVVGKALLDCELSFDTDGGGGPGVPPPGGGGRTGLPPPGEVGIFDDSQLVTILR